MLDETQKSNLIALFSLTISNLTGIWVYGSVAQSVATTSSDVDLAFLSNDLIPYKVQLDLKEKLAQLLQRDIDLVELNSASTVLRKEIIAYGKRIYCTDTLQCENYENFVFADYARLNEERAGILEDVFKRGSIYG